MIYSLLHIGKIQEKGMYSPEMQEKVHHIVYSGTDLQRPLFRMMGEDMYAEYVTVQGAIEGKPQFFIPESEYAKGKFISFSLVATPTKQRGGKYIPLQHKEDQIKWVASKFKDALFNTEITGELIWHLKKKSTDKNVCYPVVLFRIKGFIQDQDKFVSIMNGGVGKRKAYGMGMVFDSRAAQHFISVMQDHYDQKETRL